MHRLLLIFLFKWWYLFKVFDTFVSKMQKKKIVMCSFNELSVLTLTTGLWFNGTGLDLIDRVLNWLSLSDSQFPDRKRGWWKSADHDLVDYDSLMPMLVVVKAGFIYAVLVWQDCRKYICDNNKKTLQMCTCILKYIELFLGGSVS